jgi:HK97 family phage major capsid protein
MLDVNELIRKKNLAWSAGNAIKEKAKGENRDMNGEEETAFDRILAELDDLDRKIERGQKEERQRLRMAAAAMEETVVVGGKAQGADEKGGDGVTIYGTKEYANAFRTYLAGGFERMVEAERAGLQVDIDVKGGLIVASEQFVAEVVKEADAECPFRQLAKKIPIEYGQSLGALSRTGRVSKFKFAAGELTAAEVEDGLAVGKREMQAHAIQRKTLPVSKRLLESSNARINIESFIAEEVAYALATTLEEAYMIGTGDRQPLGVFVASADGIPSSRWVSSGNTTTLIKEDGLVEAQGKLRPAYRSQARWLFHTDALTKIRKLKTTEGQYLWQPGLQLGQVNLLLGQPIIESEFAPNTFTAGKAVGLYGDFGRYWIADGMSMVVQRLVEKYAETGQIGFLFDKLCGDGMPILAEAFVVVALASS